MEERRYRLGGGRLLAVGAGLLAAGSAIAVTLTLGRPELTLRAGLVAAASAVLVVLAVVPSTAAWQPEGAVVIRRLLGSRTLPTASVRAVRRTVLCGSLSLLVLHAGGRRHRLWVTGQHGMGLIWRLRESNIRLDVRGALQAPGGRAPAVREGVAALVQPAGYSST